MAVKGRFAKAGCVLAAIIISVTVWVLFSAAAFKAAMYLGDLGSSGAYVNWERTQTPDGQIRDLRLGENGEILLEMEDGRLFHWDPSAWNRIDKPSGRGPQSLACRPVDHSGFRVKDPPFAPKERILVDCYNMELSIHYEFALSDADEVWMWHWLSSDLSYAYYLPFLLAGMVLSLAGFIVIIVADILMIRRRFRPKPMASSAPSGKRFPGS
jgi:hypothetical protein